MTHDAGSGKTSEASLFAAPAVSPHVCSLISHSCILALASVTSLSMSPVDDSFLSASLDRSVRLWDVRTPICQGLLNIPDEYASERKSADDAGKILVAHDPNGSAQERSETGIRRAGPSCSNSKAVATCSRAHHSLLFSPLSRFPIASQSSVCSSLFA